MRGAHVPMPAQAGGIFQNLKIKKTCQYQIDTTVIEMRVAVLCCRRNGVADLVTAFSSFRRKQGILEQMFAREPIASIPDVDIQQLLDRVGNDFYLCRLIFILSCVSFVIIGLASKMRLSVFSSVKVRCRLRRR